MPHQSEPPPPDVTTQPRLTSETVLELLFSRTNQFRLVISRDRRGLFRIHRDKWCVSDWDIIGEAFWIQDGHFVTMTDTLASARQLAREALQATSDGT